MEIQELHKHLEIGNIWRIYHLTYSANNSKGYPKYEEFSSVKAAAEYIQDKIYSILN